MLPRADQDVALPACVLHSTSQLCPTEHLTDPQHAGPEHVHTLPDELSAFVFTLVNSSFRTSSESSPGLQDDEVSISLLPQPLMLGGITLQQAWLAVSCCLLLN